MVGLQGHSLLHPSRIVRHYLHYVTILLLSTPQFPRYLTCLFCCRGTQNVREFCGKIPTYMCTTGTSYFSDSVVQSYNLILRYSQKPFLATLPRSNQKETNTSLRDGTTCLTFIANTKQRYELAEEKRVEDRPHDTRVAACRGLVLYKGAGV